MQRYIGTKLINAEPMNRSAYNTFRGWQLPADENVEDNGYLVEYIDGGPPNTEHYHGYVSWSPKEVFDNAYRPVDGMSFGLAIEAMKMGKAVTRAGWNGKGMFVCLMPPLYLPPFSTADTARKVNDRTAKWIGEDQPLDCQPYIAMYNAQKKWQPGWAAAQSDMLADDWMIVE